MLFIWLFSFSSFFLGAWIQLANAVLLVPLFPKDALYEIRNNFLNT